jgi:hypothetical protein
MHNAGGGAGTRTGKDRRQPLPNRVTLELPVIRQEWPGGHPREDAQGVRNTGTTEQLQ